MIKIKRIYEPASAGDGTRILVDRLWPRGVSREKARIDEWMKEIGPSSELRKWFGHEPGKWNEFRKRFVHELKQKDEQVGRLLEDARDGTITLVYGSKETRYNNAVVLKEFLEELLDGRRKKAA